MIYLKILTDKCYPKKGGGDLFILFYISINIFVHISMNILGEQIFVHLILHIYNRIKRNNICPPRPHIDQYIWARIFLFIYWKTYLEKKHLFTLFLPLLATFLQWWKPRLIAGRQSKRSPKNMIIVIMIIMFTHDYNHHIHSWSCWLSAGSWRDRRPWEHQHHDWDGENHVHYHHYHHHYQ